MNLEDFIETYKDGMDLSSIPWEDFPEELQEAGLRFMNGWTEDLPTRHLRELSGFDDMSVEDLLKYERKEVEDGKD